MLTHTSESRDKNDMKLALIRSLNLPKLISSIYSFKWLNLKTPSQRPWFIDFFKLSKAIISEWHTCGLAPGVRRSRRETCIFNTAGLPENRKNHLHRNYPLNLNKTVCTAKNTNSVNVFWQMFVCYLQVLIWNFDSNLYFFVPSLNKLSDQKNITRYVWLDSPE